MKQMLLLSARAASAVASIGLPGTIPPEAIKAVALYLPEFGGSIVLI